MDLTPKQTTALDYLEDNETKELAFGGGAGGGKSALGCYWVSKMCMKYEGSRYLIGRSVLKTLKQTTLQTLWEVFKMQGITPAHYKYHQQPNEIHFYNKSVILLKDLFFYPSDPNMDELGSLEITGAFIDEAIQVVKKVKDIVKSRIRFKLDENNLIPKILYTSNPGDGWLYDDFYAQSVSDTLPKERKFIQSLLPDNPHISDHYKSQLEELDEESKQRLLYGNWDYEAKGKIFPISKLKRFNLKDVDIKPMMKIGWCDVADQGADYLCFVFGAIGEDCFYIFDAIYTSKDDESAIPLIIELHEKYNINKSVFESNGHGLAYYKLFLKSLKIMDLENKTGLYEKWKNRTGAVPSKGNKHSRITIQAETNILKNFIFIDNGNDMYNTYLKMLTKYKYDKSVKQDDAPDATAGLSILSQKYN